MPETYSSGIEFSYLDVEDNVFVGLMKYGTVGATYYAVFGKCSTPKLTETKYYAFAHEQPVASAIVDSGIDIKAFAYNGCTYKMIKLDNKDQYDIVKRAVFAALKEI